MRSALALSGTAHGLLGLALVLALPWSKLIPPAPPASFDVEYVTIDEQTAVTEAPKPSMAAAPRDTVKSLDQAQDDDASAAVGTQPQPSDAPPPPDAKPADTTKRLDAQRLENLIDKRLKQADRKPLDVSNLARTIEKAIAQDSLVDSQASANLAQAVRQMVERCWNPPMGAEKLGQMWVTIRMSLNEDGTLSGTPELVGYSSVRADQQAVAQAVADSARRAVIRCAPYALPVEKYRLWRDLELRFDPSQMAG